MEGFSHIYVIVEHLFVLECFEYHNTPLSVEVERRRNTCNEDTPLIV